MIRALCLALGLSLAGSPLWAEVVVNYAALANSHDPDLRTESDRRTVAAELDRRIQRLGERYLKPGEVLHIQITRVDLAGQYEQWRTGWQDVRILRDITPPRIHMHYTLFQNGKPIRQGTAQLSDINYLSDPRARGDDERLIHEKLLLDDWFRKTFRP